MTRRNVELVLLLVAAPVVALLFAMIAINQGQSLDMTTLGVPAAIFVAFVIAHLAVRKFAANADPALLPLSFALSGIGIAFVTSLAPNLAVGQVMWLFVGVACMVLVLVFVRNLDKVANYKYTLMIVGFLLLLSPLVPGLGQEIYGSRIWLHIGSYPSNRARSPRSSSCCSWRATSRRTARCCRCSPGAWARSGFPTSERCCRCC